MLTLVKIPKCKSFHLVWSLDINLETVLVLIANNLSVSLLEMALLDSAVRALDTRPKGPRFNAQLMHY